MKTTRSPWIHQLDTERATIHLSHDLVTDVAIIGAGIAGISTAFFLLKHTTKRVVILEKNILAHGATGHNAGQVVSYFERPFNDIVKSFGIELAVEGQRSIDSSWMLIDEMYHDAGLTIPFSKFEGHAGFSSLEQVLHELEDLRLKHKGGLQPTPLYIADECTWKDKIPAVYSHLWQTRTLSDIFKVLETENQLFFAMHSEQKGCINSALFCQEILIYLIRTYKERFVLYENTPINKIVLKHDKSLIDAMDHTVEAQRVVLCTNGFEGLTIINETGLDIDVKFHHDVEGKVGYMSGYLETMNKPPAAISYYEDLESTIHDRYFYLTRREHEHEGKKDYNLICVGGPDISLEDRAEYIRDYDFPEEAQKEIDDFVKSTYDTDPNKKINYQFTWHGLMGYTPNGIRRIGVEPRNPILLYNLGCNGVGILPSIYGGMRISKIIAGEVLPKSIFDPQ